MVKTGPTYLLGYGCCTAAGQGALALFDALRAGRDLSAPADTGAWPCRPAQPVRVCLVPGGDPALTSCERLARQLERAWDEAAGELPEAVMRPLAGRLGVIFASTKGCTEDRVWTAAPEAMRSDPLAPVLARFLERTGLRPVRAVCVSNACTSAHVALQLAHIWLASGAAAGVLVLAADEVGPFVACGFASLKSLAPERVTPFGAGRQGIQLGEAAAALLLTGAVGPLLAGAPRLVRLRAVDTRVEGYALTRSNDTGDTLAEACRLACEGTPPDLIVAHGTGTVANDALEERVYARLFGTQLPVTCTKWSVGHSLGASGAVDVIAAAEALRLQAAFAIANTAEVDPAFRCRYLAAGRPPAAGPLARVLVASAGFGGMHGAALLERL